MSDNPHSIVSTMTSDTIAAHGYSTVAIIGAFMGYLPDVAAGFAAVWYLLVIWESKTVQGWFRHRSKTEKPTPEDSHGE